MHGSAEARVDPDQCDHGRDYGSGNGSDCKVTQTVIHNSKKMKEKRTGETVR